MQNSPNLARQQHQMHLAQQQQQQQQQQPPPQQQQQQQGPYSRQPQVANIRLRQDFLQFKNSFSNAVKQMASDLVASAEAISTGSSTDSSRKPQQPSTESLLNDFDTAYTQLDYNLSLLHRSFMRQQQVILQNQAAQSGLLSNQIQNEPPNPENLRLLVDRLGMLLKPPAHVTSASSADSARQQLPRPNDPTAPDRGQEAMAGVKSTSSSSKSSSSNASSSRTSPTDAMGLRGIRGADMATGPIKGQELVTGAAANQRKHLIDLDYGNSDSESDRDRPSSSQNSPVDGSGGGKLLTTMEVDHPAAIVDEASLSLPVSDQEVKAHMAPAAQQHAAMIASEDSLGFGAIDHFSTPTGGQVKAEPSTAHATPSYTPGALAKNDDEDEDMLSPGADGKMFMHHQPKFEETEHFGHD